MPHGKTTLKFVGFPRKTGVALALIPTPVDTPGNVGVFAAVMLTPDGTPSGAGTVPAVTLTPVGFPTNVGVAVAEILTPVGFSKIKRVLPVTVTAILEEVVLLPTASRATAVSVCAPFEVKVAFQVMA